MAAKYTVREDPDWLIEFVEKLDSLKFSCLIDLSVLLSLGSAFIIFHWIVD